MIKTQIEFQNWLAEMQSSINDLVDQLPEPVRDHLNYSIESLDVLEQWLIKSFSHISTLREPQAASLLEGTLRYVGEAHVRNMEGCHWDVNLTLPDMIYANEPVIMGPVDNPFIDSPQSMVLTAVDRRKGNLMSISLAGRKNNRAPIYREKRRSPIILNKAMWNEWLGEMEMALNYFISYLPEDIGSKLNYSPDSLDVLSAWLLQQCPGRTLVRNNQFPQITDGAARYVGETFVRTLGAKWDVILDKPADPYFRFPIVRGQGKKRYKYCPTQMITFRVIKDGMPDYLRMTLEKEIGK